jgi:hypothetical protein
MYPPVQLLYANKIIKKRKEKKRNSPPIKDTYTESERMISDIPS